MMYIVRSITPKRAIGICIGWLILSPKAWAGAPVIEVMTGYRSLMTAPAAQGLEIGAGLRRGGLRFELAADWFGAGKVDDLTHTIAIICDQGAPDGQSLLWRSPNYAGAFRVDWNLGAPQIQSAWTGGIHLRGGLEAIHYQGIQTWVEESGFRDALVGKDSNLIGPTAGVVFAGWWKDRLGLTLAIDGTFGQVVEPKVVGTNNSDEHLGLLWSFSVGVHYAFR